MEIRLPHPGRLVLGAKVENDQAAGPERGVDQRLEKRFAAAVEPMQVLEQDHLRLLLSARLGHAPHDVKHLPLTRLRIDARGRVLRIGDSHEVEDQRQALAQALVEQE